VTTIEAPRDTGSPELEITTAPVAASRQPPAWLQMFALMTAAGVLTFGGVGLVLAINGWYRPALAFPLGAVAWLLVLRASRSAVASASPTRSSHLAAALAVFAILGVTGWNAAHASEHMIIDRDGGSYLNTGRWIARDGSLEPEVAGGPFARDPTLVFDSYAVYDMPNGKLEFQFAHLLPAVLAQAHAIGGDRGLTRAPEVLGGVALLAFFVLAWRLFNHPWFALAAMLALAFIIPQVSFSRDAYSETPSQILLFTAAWLIVSPRVLSGGRTPLIAGMFLGALQAVRIDAAAIFVGVPPMLAYVWLRAAGRRREAGLAIGAFALGMLPGVVLGLVDLMHHSGGYWNGIWQNERRVLTLVGASAVASLLVVGVWSLLHRHMRRAAGNAISSAAALSVAAFGFGMWFVRPRIQHVQGSAIELIGTLQAREGLAVDGTRRYFEQSMHWMVWYVGPITVSAAIVGAALLVGALLRGRCSHVVGALAILIPGTALYLYRASAFPDHIWVMRRFLVNALPTLILLGVGLGAYTFQAGRQRVRGNLVRRLSVVLAACAVAYPLYTVAGVEAMSEKRGSLAVVDDACAYLGPHAAVVVLQTPADPLFDDWAPQTLRSFCGAEVAVTRGGATTASVQGLANAWQEQGRRLYLVASSDEIVRVLLPDPDIVLARRSTDAHTLTQTLTHRPRGYRAESLAMVIAQVAPG
jgi:hypothetical protein